MNEDLGLLFHKLNNQLGIILANAELLEAKLGEDAARARASQVVASALEAMTTAREIRLLLKSDTGITHDPDTTSTASRPDLSN
jgi:hypothetical protein